MIQFESTRRTAPKVDFFEALLQGLAPDGGLYNPTVLPRAIRSPSVSRFNFAACAQAVARQYDRRLNYSLATYRAIFPFAPQVRMIDTNMALLELFHGPTCAFKDYGASFLAHAMDEELRRRTQHITILTATSGDTGSAVAHAFYQRAHIKVAVLFPAGRISPLQRQQITCYGNNIHALEVAGSFDDCQRLVKEAFGDQALNEQIALSSANSINIGRLLPQQFYYHFGYWNVRRHHSGRIFFCVPSGNLGILTAGLLAQQCERGIAGFIAASNANRVFPRYLRRGSYRPRSSRPTLSNAMDVGRPSNLERLRALFNDNIQDIRRAIPLAVAVSDRRTLHTIRAIYQRYHIIVDPHTATGLHAAHRFLTSHSRPDDLVVVVATAHPAKFSATVMRALGVEPPLPPQLQAVLHKQSYCTSIPADYDHLRGLLLQKFAR